MGRSATITAHLLKGTESDPYLFMDEARLALAFLARNQALHQLQASFLAWLTRIEQLLRPMMSTSSSDNNKIVEALKFAKENNIRYVDGRPLNRTLVQCTFNALMAFDQKAKKTFHMLERLTNKTSSLHSEKLRRCLTSCKQMSTGSSMTLSDVFNFVLQLLVFHTTSLTRSASSSSSICTHEMVVSRQGSWMAKAAVTLRVLTTLKTKKVVESVEVDQFKSLLNVFSQPELLDLGLTRSRSQDLSGSEDGPDGPDPRKKSHH